MKLTYKSRTEIEAFWAQKCPRCRQGDMFKSSTYNVFRFGETNEVCPYCQLHFEREPGFFTGAMYFSYAINVALIAIVGIGVQLIFSPDIFILVGIISFTTLLAMPFTFRYSRMMMMYLFSGAKYDAEKAQNIKV